MNGSTNKLDPIGFGSSVMVKIGSALIGETLIGDVVRFSALGHQMIIVTSGAAAVGSSHFNHLDRSLPVEEKQTAAAIGQVSTHACL
ncbi:MULTISPECIES: hypothetical protein [unclassified Mesorhizobium]|uniref:hypothetical protein n=1 Tax=unclassified Mesorhizobium TaxID=325217 RepID=UPI0003CF7C08|nr:MULTISPECIES: hypothetical protein [unclassified Mesorhizobium]ESY10762.1 hypothetical protein X751_30655 [Mesorhizobium sp. LNJC395A00]WJI74795.1 hypothetical protein NLY37_28360 [Mesorhizobium sp. C395A]